MSEKLTKLKYAYSNLSYSERLELKNFIRTFDDSSDSKRDELNESFRKSLGPINSASCPCCGK